MSALAGSVELRFWLVGKVRWRFRWYEDKVSIRSEMSCRVSSTAFSSSDFLLSGPVSAARLGSNKLSSQLSTALAIASSSVAVIVVTAAALSSTSSPSSASIICCRYRWPWRWYHTRATSPDETTAPLSSLVGAKLEKAPRNKASISLTSTSTAEGFWPARLSVLSRCRSLLFLLGGAALL